MISARRRVRRLVAMGGTGVAWALLFVSISWACTQPNGSTFFSDGRLSKSVTKGARISAFATSAFPGIRYELVIGSNGSHPAHACHDKHFVVNPNIRLATGDGFIGSTSGPAGNASLASGTYQV
ncbi:MAG: hypothetical protein LC808_40305, partial [Actinobacteria bacterium]|nr:hypothetical protein [Actinomycetota bacterium]